MKQRRAASGRPSGTDGSDFSYRMVVDPRYSKVAKGKSHLGILLAIQGLGLVLGSLFAFFVASQEKGIDNFAVLSLSIGFISLIIGDIGRRRSQVNLLRFYVVASSIATALSVFRCVRSGLFLKIMQYQNISGVNTSELVDVGLVLLGILLQVIVITTTSSLVQNMSPKRAA